MWGRPARSLACTYVPRLDVCFAQRPAAPRAALLALLPGRIFLPLTGRAGRHGGAARRAGHRGAPPARRPLQSQPRREAAGAQRAEPQPQHGAPRNRSPTPLPPPPGAPEGARCAAPARERSGRVKKYSSRPTLCTRARLSPRRDSLLLRRCCDGARRSDASRRARACRAVGGQAAAEAKESLRRAPLCARAGPSLCVPAVVSLETRSEYRPAWSESACELAEVLSGRRRKRRPARGAAAADDVVRERRFQAAAAAPPLLLRLGGGQREPIRALRGGRGGGGAARCARHARGRAARPRCRCDPRRPRTAWHVFYVWGCLVE